jgi:hypothetical protein
MVDANKNIIHSEIKERRRLGDEIVTAIDKGLGVGRRAVKELSVAFGLRRFADKSWVVVLATLLSPVWVPLYALGQVMLLLVRMTVGLDDDEIGVGAKRVPTFYSGRTGSETISALVAGMVIAMVFGGIHCVAWSFQFPSHTEQLIWRISSLTITCVPPLELVCGVIAAFTEDRSNWARNLFLAIIILAIIPYIIARLTLLVLPFMALRSLSPASYQTVQWTTFIPHV